MTGFPAPLARGAAAASPGFVPRWAPADLLIGLAATLAWLALVRWRLARHPPTLWRPVALSCGGLVLTWLLLMTLWLPAFNHRNTYRELGQQVAAQLPPGNTCVATRAVGAAQRAALQYFGGFAMTGDTDDCRWRLVQHTGDQARHAPEPPAGWALVWEGARPRDINEVLRLYRRP
jgi:hypothetical protein